MLFRSEFPVLTFSELEQKTQIPKDKLIPALIAMCNPKVRLLSKEEPKPEFKPDEKIQVNLKFQNPQTRLNVVPVPAQKKKTIEATEEDKEMEKGIKQERQLVCDGYIVKVMKTHKTVNHQDLMTKVIAQISTFQAQPAMIKQDRKSTRLNSSHIPLSRMPSSA